MEETAALEPGPYGLTPVGPDSGPVAVIDVPAGYVGGTFLFPAGDASDAADECCIVGYWTVSRVYRDPCKQGAAQDPGTGVQDLADALVAQRTTSTKPTAVSLGGYEGLYLELTAPGGLGHLEDCKNEEIVYWESDPGDRYFDATHYDEAQGLPVERIWILDVAGKRVVLSAGTESGADEDQAQALVDIVESARFV